MTHFLVWGDLVRLLRLDPSIDTFDWVQRHNLAPTQDLLTAIHIDGETRVGNMHWGIKPDFADRMIVNAQSEKYLAEGRNWWSGFRRCVIPASGFYEWKGAKGAKQPMYIQLKDGEPFLLAGLYKVEKDSEGLPGKAVVVTTTPNELMKPIHHRMPSILLPEYVEEWLDPKTDRMLLSAALEPYPTERMEAWRVSNGVNNVANDGPDLIEPVDGPADEGAT